MTHLPELWSGDEIRMNEGGCDPDGRFLCGTMAYDQRPGAGSLYRLDPDRSVTLVLEGVTISNGLEWSPDGTLAYYVDTPTREISVFDYDSAGGLQDRRPFAVSVEAMPDGLTVDADGGVWVALYDGRAVQHFGAGRHAGRAGARPRGPRDRVHVRRRGPRPAVHHDVARGPVGRGGAVRRVPARRRRRRPRASGA